MPSGKFFLESEGNFFENLPSGVVWAEQFWSSDADILFTVFNFKSFLCPRLLSEGVKMSNRNEKNSTFSRGRLAAPKQLADPKRWAFKSGGLVEGGGRAKKTTFFVFFSTSARSVRPKERK